MTGTGHTSSRHRLRDYREREDCLLPRANWGRGRLQRYQSFHSFAATFCALNLLKPRRFRDYWERSFPWAECDEAVPRIASYLDEPLDVVETVFGKERLSIAGWSYRRDDSPSKNTVSYCPTCVVTGFHGYFHENPNLRRCPIHGTDLFRDFISSKTPCHIDQYVESLAQLFAQANGAWPAMGARAETCPDCEPTALLEEFLCWEGHAKKAKDGWHGLNCFYGIRLRHTGFRIWIYIWDAWPGASQCQSPCPVCS